jgi:hypothetical protein
MTGQTKILKPCRQARNFEYISFAMTTFFFIFDLSMDYLNRIDHLNLSETDRRPGHGRLEGYAGASNKNP